MERRIRLPMGIWIRRQLRAGEALLLDGRLFTARDAAHRRMVEFIEAGRQLPVDLKDEVVFYAGPAPVPPGKASGSIGPTTSYRMDPYTPQLALKGVAAFIGKGPRSAGVCEDLREKGVLYLVAAGGTAALLGSRVRSVRPVAFAELGPEAIFELEVEAFPVVVACDLQGGNIFSHLGGA
jgi:fumarate hydratase subunit beta